MYEYEVKLKIQDASSVTDKLAVLGFESCARIREEDLYFNNPAHDLKARDEALRIRKSTDLLTGNACARMNFKGPKIDTISMSRKEIETEIADADAVRAIFEALDYAPVSPIIKIRQYFRRENVTACVDDVEGLGAFIELEILADDTAHDEALETIGGILESLGLSMADSITRSYLSMYEEKYGHL